MALQTKVDVGAALQWNKATLASSGFPSVAQKINSRDRSDCCMILSAEFVRFNFISTIRGAFVNLTSFTSPINPVCGLQDIVQTRISNITPKKWNLTASN